MRVLLSDFVLVCNDEFDIIKDGGVCFDEKILEIGNSDVLLAKYKNAEVEKLPKNSVLMPGLVNAHVHLEFGANVATLKYGDFMEWLKSVISSREELSGKCTEAVISASLEKMLKDGVTTIGAVSSFGLDMKACIKTPLNTVYFVEAIGSNPAAIDALFADFKSRYYEAKEAKTNSFTPAVSVHSPYSTHPILARRVLDIAKNDGAAVSAHFMESAHERKWLDSASGAMGEFMKNFNPRAKPMTTAIEFLELFRDVKTLFIHAVWARDDELKLISGQKNAVVHCPRSNALLGTGALDIKRAQKALVPLTLGTDGLSSNINLNLWDEMRAALFTHQTFALGGLAVLLLKAATCEGAKALGLNKGVLESGFDADIIALELAEVPCDISDIALHTILQTKTARRIFISGKEIQNR
ncbi:MAG: metal-dependent hydrolase [Campylobacteraceae bacterium]|jgi:cytosine/adenosine deaminase-related metal-dependent hydrolase|nr:metal-dependent hydrolase [Campylobacteraceae bacterium]